jgi:acyl-CoA thioesterase
MDPHEIARRCAEQMYAGDIASQRLGIEIGEVGPGRARARMPVRDDMVNGHGICHGGYVFALADTAVAFACNSHGDRTVVAGADVSFLQPVAAGAVLTALAVERVRQGRSGIYDVTVQTEDGTVVAEFRGRSRSLGKAWLVDDA